LAPEELDTAILKTTIPLTGHDVWVAERTPTALGELSGLEIAKHIFDARHFSKITSFEYHRKRGTRNTMDPVPPAFGMPRGPTSATAEWLHETLIVTFDCEGQDAGDDRVIVALLPEGRVPWEFDCSKAGDLRLVKNRDAGSAEPVSAVVTERDDGRTAGLRMDRCNADRETSGRGLRLPDIRAYARGPEIHGFELTALFVCFAGATVKNEYGTTLQTLTTIP